VKQDGCPWTCRRGRGAMRVMAKARAGLADGDYDGWLTRIREMPRAGPSLAFLLGLGAACADPGDTERVGG
jgi:hypothetical protein